MAAAARTAFCMRIVSVVLFLVQRSGGSAAGPVFNVVAAEALRILDVQKDLPETPEKDDKKPAKPNPKDVNDLSIAGLDDSQPNILEDDDASGQEKPLLSQIGPRVPNFRGKSVREVMALASQSGIPVVLAGSGIVNYQMPLAGEVLLPGQKVKVNFTR